MDYKKYDKTSEYSYCFGGFPTYELLTQKPNSVIEIILHDKLEKNEDTEKILSLAKKHKLRVSHNSKMIEKLSGKGNVYIMAVFKKYDSPARLNVNQVLLHNPSDAGNLGTIIRVMLGFGYKDLCIIKPCVDPFDPKTIRASMGSIFSMNITLFDTLDDYLKVNKSHIYPFMLQANTHLQDLESKNFPHTLAFGNEARGLDDNYLNIGTPLKIRHSSNIDSLNLSMAVGIALYEFNK